MPRPFCLPFLCLTLAAQAPVTVPTRLTRVRVHPDEAWTTRSGRVHLQGSGTWRLDLPDLPKDTTLEDLRVSASGPAGLKLGDLSLVRPGQSEAERKAREEARQERLMPLEARLEALRAEISTLRRAAEVRAVESQARPLEAPALIESARVLHGRLGELLLAEKRLALEVAAARKEVPAGPHASLEATTPVEGDVEVTLQVRTRQARWKPSYEARLDAGRQKLELALFATVTQTSGEDWGQVPMELATARGQGASTPPSLDEPVAIGWMQTLLPPPPPPAPPIDPSQEVVPEYAPNERPKENLSLAYAGTGVSAGAAVSAGAPEPLRQALEAPSQALVQSGVGTTFLLEGPRTVSTDARPHRFLVRAITVQPALTHVAMPRQSSEVHLEARFTPTAELPLFQGAPLVPFMGEQRLAQRSLEQPQAGEAFSLPLGAVEGLSARLERVRAINPYRLTRTEVRGHGADRTVTRRVDTTGATRLWEVDERLVIANRGTDKVSVEVLDRPIRSVHEKVQATQKATPAAELLPDRLKWILDVPAHGTAAVALQTRIQGPREGDLTGLGALGLGE